MKTAIAATDFLQLDAIPKPPMHVRRLMLALATILDGFIDQAPEDLHPALENALLVLGADVVVAGTRSQRPLLCRELKNIAEAMDLNAIIVRPAEEPRHATFDVVLRQAQRPFLGYRLWMRQPMGNAWLVPTAGGQTYIRLDGLGLELSPEPPFLCDIDANRGLKAASEYLAVAAKGWF